MSNRTQEIIDTTHDSDHEDHSSGSEPEHQGHATNTPDAPQASSSKRKKKKSKATKVLDSLRGNKNAPVTAEQGAGVASPSAEAILQALNQLNLMDALKGKSSVAGRGKNAVGEHKVSSPFGQTLSPPYVTIFSKFWATQPVPQSGKPNRLDLGARLNGYYPTGDQPAAEDGYIEPTKAIQDVRQEPYPLPKDFEWAILDLNDPKQVCARWSH